MNTITTKGILLGVGLLGALTTASITTASAQPRNNRAVKAQRRDVKEARRDLREEQRELRQAQLRNQRRPGRPGYSQRSNFTGQVTRVRSQQSFDIRVGGSTYNVYTLSRVPRAISTGDLVRVNGIRQDNNDIRSATVSLIRNR